MSVPEGRRNESGLKFLSNARDIEVGIMKLRITKPKRYSFFFDKLIEVSIDIYSYAKAGNSIYPDNQAELRERLFYFKKAIASCQELVSQIDVMVEVLKEDTIPFKALEILANQINEEIRLLKGLITSDKNRFSGLPN